MAKRGAADCESWVLVFYTGGTIGMTENEKGALVPAKHAFEPLLRKQWQTFDPDYSARFSHLPNPPLVLPARKGECRVIYRIHEFSPLLDSSNMTLNDWIHIAHEIEKNYDNYDGFVVLHGTDTLAYTASALSFMLENLGKTIVITGAQVPMFQSRSDAIGNFLASLIIAGNYVIPEVTVFFGDKLFRGNRTLKVACDLDQAFDSPNEAPLAYFGSTLLVNSHQVFRPGTIEKFCVFSELNPNVAILHIFPSITSEIVEAFLKPPIEGVVLHTYGSGNVPDNRDDIILALTNATARGVIIVNCTQCLKGAVRDIYGISQSLADAGVISGYDMTAEAAVTKLSYVLSKKLDLDTKRKMMLCNLRGELTLPTISENLAADFDEMMVESLIFSPKKEANLIKDIFFPAAMCSAAASGDVAQLTFLEKQGADFMMGNADLRTPLHLACSEGHIKTVELALLRGASVHVTDRFGRTPLNDAIDNCRFDVIPMLLNCGAKLCDRSNQSTIEAMCRASARGDLEILKSYQLAGASLNEKNLSGRTPLHMAVLCKQYICVKHLLANGADHTIKDLMGHTPLDIAILHNDITVLNFLQNF